MFESQNETVEDESEIDEDFDYVAPPPRPQNEDFSDQDFDECAAYHSFVETTYLVPQRKRKSSERDIIQASYPRLRMVLIARLESYLDYKIKVTTKTMQSILNNKDQRAELDLLTTVEAGARLKAFHEAIKSCWDMVIDFRGGLEERVADMYKDQTTKVYESKIWDDIQVFGISLVEQLEEQMAKYTIAVRKSMEQRIKGHLSGKLSGQHKGNPKLLRSVKHQVRLEGDDE